MTIMRRINILLGTILIVFASACTDNLDLAPVSELSTSNYYKTDTDFELAINAVYSGLRSEYSDIILFTDIRSDNTIPVISGSVTTRTDFDSFSILPTNGSISGRWNSSYSTISRINAILDRIDEATIDSVLKNRIRGEALFIRGLIYFNLVRIYGNIPLVITEISPAESLELAQSTSTVVYQQILSDVTEAATLLPAAHGANDIGRATSIAANTLLGKIQLTMGNFTAAETALKSVISKEGAEVDLLANYADVFDITNEYNKEIIFAVRWTDDGVNGNAFNYGYTNINEAGNKASQDLYDEFENGDLRRDQTLNTTISASNILIYKYGTAPAGQGESDWPVLRYSDVLLMLAEAVNEKAYVADGEAFDLINRVRSRAGLAQLTSTTVGNQASFRLAIEHERRVELASEGHRWFDLVRTERYIDVMTPKGFNVKAHHNLFPIPESEILKINDSSILGQNPGY